MSNDERPTVPPPGRSRPPERSGDLTVDDRLGEIDPGSDAPAMFRTGAFEERYQGGALLGTGGMGVVRVFGDRATGRAVAIKTIRGDLRDATVRRFAREARIQAQLEHPAIVPVYDLGVDAAGALYFTMKRVRGESLAAVLLGLAAERPDYLRRYSTRKLLTALGLVANAIEYAHSRGVVHRDLKPANVMLGPFGEVYVLDWGLAAVDGIEPDEPIAPLDPSALLALASVPLIDSSQRPQTASGQMLGTPGYLAPEHIRGEHGPDGAGDVYALGCLLFEILTLERTHLGDNLSAILMSTLSTDGASPIARAPAAAVPPELDTLCRQATRKLPADRLGSAREFATALEHYLDGDRDLERRRQLAADSAHAAATALARSHADADDEAARGAALRDLTTALAFDPENAEARATLLALLTEPSRAAERAAAEAGRAARVAGLKVASRNAALAELTYLLYIPLLLWMGVRSWPLLGVMATSILGVVAISTYYWRRPPADGVVPLVHIAATTAALGTGFLVFGPLILVPALALSTSIAYIASADGRYRLVVGAGLVALLAPIVLAWLGVLPRTMEVVGGELRIAPALAAFPTVPTWALLIATHVVVLVACNVFVARLRRGYLDAQARLRAQAWQLAQLVPAGSRPELR